GHTPLNPVLCASPSNADSSANAHTQRHLHACTTRAAPTVVGPAAAFADACSATKLREQIPAPPGNAQVRYQTQIFPASSSMLKHDAEWYFVRTAALKNRNGEILTARHRPHGACTACIGIAARSVFQSRHRTRWRSRRWTPKIEPPDATPMIGAVSGW